MENHANELRTIFQRFLGFLSPQGVEILLDYSRQIPECQNFVDLATSLLTCSVNELERLIYMPGDEEDHVMFLNVFLWQQKQGRINSQQRIHYDFQEWDNQLIIHREMVANGYEYIDQISFVDFEGNSTNYAIEIDKCLKLYQFPEYDDDDYFSYLTSILNVIGPRINNHPRLNEIKKFVTYILDHLHIDPRLKWLQPAPFSILIYDLDCNPEITWSAYCQLVRTGCRSIYDVVAALLGFRMYGSKVQQVWTPFNIFGGIQLIELLA